MPSVTVSSFPRRPKESESGSPVAQSARFPRNTAARSTIHGGATSSARTRYNAGTAATTGGAKLSPHDMDSADPSGIIASGPQARMSFLNKLTSKFSRRLGSALVYPGTYKHGSPSVCPSIHVCVCVRACVH